MTFTSISIGNYREKVLGCWLGKAVGGTLGGPVEGQEGPLSLTFYDPLPGRMLPNDDLDLQIVWLEALRRRGLPVDRRLLADAWLEHIRLWPDEYGVASRNLTQGLYPPVSGYYDNGFTAGMGSAIRTEIWACLAPGDPELAAALAREDACVDHAGEGIYAAEYLAALESAAFVSEDRETLLDTPAQIIPADCRVARAIADTRRWWDETRDWMLVRERILVNHGRQNFTDVAQNLAFIVLGWLTGEGDFDKAICTAVNCGKDTDCTGATLGALLGILNPQSIGQHWLEPIGRDLVLSPGMVGMHHPATLDELTDHVLGLAVQVLPYYGSSVALTIPTLPLKPDPGLSPPRHHRPDTVSLRPSAAPTESLVATEPLAVYVTYPPAVALPPGQPSEIGVRILNPTQDRLTVRLRVRVPNGWALQASACELHLIPGQSEKLSFTVTPPPADAVRVYRNPLDLDFETQGLRWTVTAGLVTMISWRRWPIAEMTATYPQMPQNAEVIQAPGHFQPLPDGPHAFTVEFKQPYHSTMRLIVQAPRQVRVWLDGHEINRHDGHWRVPAVHRARETGKDVPCHRGWHRLTVAVGDGRGGELFVGLGHSESWDWLRDAEWRLPQPVPANTTQT